MLGVFKVTEWRSLMGWLRDGIFPAKVLVAGMPSPSVSAGANLGSGSVALAPGSTDVYGEVQIVPGAGTAAGEMAIISFAKSIVNTSFDPLVGWGTGNKTSGQVSSSLNSLSSFSIYFSSAPTSGVTYWVSYFNVQAPA